jgi:hypothetical protein
MTKATRLALDEINELTNHVVVENSAIAAGELDPRDAVITDTEAEQIARELSNVECNELRWALQMLVAAHERRAVAIAGRNILRILAGP